MVYQNSRIYYLRIFISCKMTKLPKSIVLAFGGDGTILRAKKIALKTIVPILGINIGYLGFLSETTLGELKSSLRDLLNKKYRLQERMLIQCQLSKKWHYHL